MNLPRVLTAKVQFLLSLSSGVALLSALHIPGPNLLKQPSLGLDFIAEAGMDHMVLLRNSCPFL